MLSPDLLFVLFMNTVALVLNERSYNSVTDGYVATGKKHHEVAGDEDCEGEPVDDDIAVFLAVSFIRREVVHDAKHPNAT